jgi:hypothetical protein
MYRPTVEPRSSGTLKEMTCDAVVRSASGPPSGIGVSFG